MAANIQFDETGNNALLFDNSSIELKLDGIVVLSINSSSQNSNTPLNLDVINCESIYVMSGNNNVTVNSTTVVVSSETQTNQLNNTILSIGSNVTVNATTIMIGNSSTNTVINNSGFFINGISPMPSTGDVKLTLKTTADSGWVLANDTSIGDASSGATGRANNDTANLFTLIWTVTSNTFCGVSSGRGASAAADFAAHKTINLPKALGRALAIYGSGAGLTARSMAETLGEESHTLSVNEIPSHKHDGTYYSGDGSQTGILKLDILNGLSANTYSTANTGGGQAHNNMQPTLFLNAMIKL